MTRAGRWPWTRPLVSTVGLVVAYYAVPIGQTGERLGLQMLLVLGAVGALAWAITGQVRRHLRGDPQARLASLATLLVLVVVVFALGYVTLARARPEQIPGLTNRTDGLYFTISTLTTVGFGDVHAEGQLARALVTLQMVFDVVFVAAGAATLSTGLRARRGRPTGSGEGT